MVAIKWHQTGIQSEPWRVTHCRCLPGKNITPRKEISYLAPLVSTCSTFLSQTPSRKIGIWGKKPKFSPFSIFSRNKYIFRLVFVPKLEIAWSSREMFKVQDFEVIRDKYQGASLALFRFLVRFHKFHSYIPSIFYFLEPNSPCFCCTSLDVCTVLSQGIQMDRSGCSPSIWAKMPKERDVEASWSCGLWQLWKKKPNDSPEKPEFLGGINMYIRGLQDWTLLNYLTTCMVFLL